MAGKFPGILLVSSAISAVVLWPTFWLWAHNPSPEEVTVEEFIARGSRGEWIVLKDAWVGLDHRVRTVMKKNGVDQGESYTYYGVTAGPDDKRPPKIFVRPQSWSEGRHQVRMLPRDHSGPPPDDAKLQTFSGTFASYLDFSGDVKDILRKEGAPEAVLLLHNDAPDAGSGLAALLVPLTLGGLGLFLLWRRRARAGDAVESKPEPPPQGVP